jgi:4'-phosphopantetheinyl transferase
LSSKIEEHDTNLSRRIWGRAAANLTLGADEIHVWRIAAFEDDADVALCAALLSKDEQTRAARFKFDRDRRLFTAAHAALRSICALYLRTTPVSVQLADGRYGKPELASDSRADLRFNLSHSGELALIGLSAKREIGVDLEMIKDFSFDEVAERFFTPREVAGLRSLPKHLQRQAFYKCWTSKEAFLKAKGTGLSGQLDEVDIVPLGADEIRISADVAGWSLAELPVGDGYVAALANEGAPLAVYLYEWTVSPSTAPQ